MQSINIVFNVDDNFAKYMSVTILSILKNLSKDYRPCFYVLGCDITDENKSKLVQLRAVREFDIEYVKVDTEKLKNVPIFSGSLGGESNYRLLLADALPNVDKALYLDVDLVVNGDLSEIWDIDIKNCYIAAVLDNPNNAHFMTFSKNNEFDAREYFNSGVWVANLQKWRKDNLCARLIKIAQEECKNALQVDQDILNFACYSKTFFLPYEWNFIPNIEISYPKRIKDYKIIHYTGKSKPWMAPTGKYAGDFWKYAKHTPFFEEIVESIVTVSPLKYHKAKLLTKVYSILLKCVHSEKKTKRYHKRINKNQFIIDRNKFYIQMKLT